MNYRHAFHAGGFADVIKHIVLVRILTYLQEKPAAFRVIDTHAGPGVTRLIGPEASRTGEWHRGIGRLLSAEPTGAMSGLLAPYIGVVAGMNPGGRLVTYPGSPALVRAWLRPQDRLVACELEPGTVAQLAQHMRGDRRVKVVTIDGWTALGAYVPPQERRGVVLIDPPFEVPGEFGRLADGLQRAHRKWPTGIYVMWYPVKNIVETDAFAHRIATHGISKILRAEISVAPLGQDRLSGTGLIIVNPPWALEGELAILLPGLAAVLADDLRGAFRLEWLQGEK